MKIWALADLHLCVSKPEKSMEIFGGPWINYQENIQKNWRNSIGANDLVLIPGDISWGMKLQEALIDLNWIATLPGKKILLKGNHDYWWPSSEKLRQALPENMDFIYNNALNLGEVSIGGARLWDTQEYHFHTLYNKEAKAIAPEKLAKNEKIFEKELHRLRLSLEKMDPKASLKIAMTHYPPIGKETLPSKASHLLETFGIDICVFGHMHGLTPPQFDLPKTRGVRYHLCSCDYLKCQPMLLNSTDRTGS